MGGKVIIDTVMMETKGKAKRVKSKPLVFTLDNPELMKPGSILRIRVKDEKGRAVKGGSLDVEVMARGGCCSWK